MRIKYIATALLMAALFVPGTRPANAQDDGMFYADPGYFAATSYATESAEIYTGPGARFTRSGQVLRGEQLTLLGCEQSLDWCLVGQREGMRGWVESRYLRGGFGRNYSILDMNADGRLHILVIEGVPARRSSYDYAPYRSHHHHHYYYPVYPHKPKPRPDRPPVKPAPPAAEKPKPFEHTPITKGDVKPICPLGVSTC